MFFYNSIRNGLVTLDNVKPPENRNFLKVVSGKKCLCEKRNHANLPWNQAILRFRHSNNATKSLRTCCWEFTALTPLDSAMKEQEWGDMKVNHGGWKEKESWRMRDMLVWADVCC